jgi:hypothetical protein
MINVIFIFKNKLFFYIFNKQNFRESDKKILNEFQTYEDDLYSILGIIENLPKKMEEINKLTK